MKIKNLLRANAEHILFVLLAFAAFMFIAFSFMNGIISNYSENFLKNILTEAENIVRADVSASEVILNDLVFMVDNMLGNNYPADSVENAITSYGNFIVAEDSYVDCRAVYVLWDDKSVVAAKFEDTSAYVIEERP